MKKVLVLSFIILLTLLTGCWDKKEIEEQAYVMVMGLDNGDKNSVDVTYQIGNPQVGSSQRGQSQNEPAEQILTFTSPDINSSRDLANSFLARKVTYEHMTTIVVAEELAKTDRFLRILYSGLRDRQIRREVKLIVSREKASEFINNNKPKMETRPHKYYQFMYEETITTGMIPNANIHGFIQCAEADADLYTIIYASTKEFKEKEGFEDDYLPGQIKIEGENKIAQMIGAAVFKEGKMIGTLTGEELRLSGELDPTKLTRRMMVTYPDPLAPDYRIAAKRSQTKNVDIEMDLKGNKPKIKAQVHVDLEMLAIPSNINYMTDPEKQKLLIQSIENGLKEKFNNLIKKTQKEFEGEPFCWSAPARRQFLTLDEYIEFDWMKSYKDIDITIDVEVDIKGFGKQIRSTNIEKVQD